MTRASILIMFLTACGGAPTETETLQKTAPIAESVMPHEKATTEQEEPPVKPEPATDYVTGWDLNKQLDTKTLEMHRLFAVRKTAKCPTREQAKTRNCGNSVEVKTAGLIVQAGEAVQVVGDGPIDGMWKTIRTGKFGTLPGWILDEDLAPRPNLDGLIDFDSRPELAKATDVTSLTAKQLRKLRKGTVAAWKRTKAIKYGEWAGGDGPRLYMVLKDGAIAIALPKPEEDDALMNYHSCLVYGDCIFLNYVCDDEYCDEVSLIARKTKKRVSLPEDPEGEWKNKPKGKVPLFEVVVIADRYGTHYAKQMKLTK